MKFTLVLVFTLILTHTAYSEVRIDVKLSPAGSFVAETKKVKGYAYKTKTGVAAENVEVEVNSLTTGISLRDKHLKERLLSKKFPKAKLIKAVGKNGVGKASIEIKGIKKTYSGTYTIDGSNLNAKFDINLPDLKITDVSYMGVGVNDKVTVNITLPLKNKK
jgi:ABC-type transport system involved in cytochrome bd biosynthesis fused ATPase/permease subunit